MLTASLVTIATLTAAQPAELDGVWKLTAIEADGDAVTPLPNNLCWTIQGSRVVYGGTEMARLEADAKATPKLFDLRFPKNDRTYEGIYSLEKKTLKVCLFGRGEGVKERPDSFETKGKAARRLLVFERVDSAGVAPGYVGVALRYDGDRKAVLVNAALDGSPAKAAGLQKDDVVLSIGANAVSDLTSAVQAVRAAKPGDKLAMRVKRGDAEKELTVAVAVLPFLALAGLE